MCTFLPHISWKKLKLAPSTLKLTRGWMFLYLAWVTVRIVMGESNGTPLQYCCLENPMDGGAWRVGHDWATSLSPSCIGEGNGNPLQGFCLENPRDGGAWWAAVYVVTQSQIRLKRLSSSSRIVTVGLGWKLLLFPCYIFRLAFEMKYILLLHLISIIWVTNYATTRLLLFYYCCNKLPQTLWLARKQFYYLTVGG